MNFRRHSARVSTPFRRKVHVTLDHWTQRQAGCGRLAGAQAMERASCRPSPRPRRRLYQSQSVCVRGLGSCSSIKNLARSLLLVLIAFSPTLRSDQVSKTSGLEVRLGYPAGARVLQDELRGAPPEGTDGVVTFTMQIDIR